MMDWLEVFFGVSPDGGNGVTEWLLAAAMLSVVLLALQLWTLRRRGHAPSADGTFSGHC
jgi:hypothetical protein